MENLLKQTVEELLEALGMETESIEVKPRGEGEPTVCSVELRSDANLLIGEHGQNLRAFEQIIRVLLAKKAERAPNVVVDVNGYRKEREQYLKNLAHSIAQKVVVEKRPFKLPPMSAFERRIIHTELASRPDVLTESQGEGGDRKVIVKPYL